MDKVELLNEFQSRVDEFERYQGFIHKAKSQSSRFAPAVVEKVVKDNTDKSLQVCEKIVPLLIDMETVIHDLSAERQTILDSRTGSKEELEELELRYEIGELTKEEFDQSSAELRVSLGTIDTRVGAMDQELEKYKAQMSRWEELGTAAGVFKKPKPQAEAKTPNRPATLGDDDLVVVEESEELDIQVLVEEDRTPDEGASDRARVTEDVSAVFGDEPVETVHAGRAPTDKLGDIDILGDDGDLDVEPQMIDEPRGGDESPRRAVLLYQEGTAEEQVYPFTNDILTVGRGRDNDIQVKNDSKVSRYHCKLYRRGPNFYIEDNKSANGSLVNGELITERRLFGGEEIIIGETFFRFRIMD